MKDIKDVTVEILGTTYTIKFKDSKEDQKLEELDGYCDYTTKDIVISIVNENSLSVKNVEGHYKHILKHELIHAFLNESGLMSSSDWATNETIVDWFALQLEKISLAYGNAFFDLYQYYNN